MQSKKTVLVVDDVSVDRRITAKCLQKAGYSVKLAYDGAKALELLEAEPADLVLVDVNMPVKDGFETLADIKKNPKLAHIPVVLMSSDVKDVVPGACSTMVRSIERGAAQFLEKPISNTTLRMCVSKLLSVKPEQTKKRGTTATNVLCVDDQQSVRMLVKRYLSRRGYKVELAENGADALELLKERREEGCKKPRIDLILLDLFMPVMDGKDFLAVIKADAEWRDIPVIVFTSDTGEEVDLNIIAAGADDCLKKPLDATVIRARIEKVLESHRLRQWVASQLEERAASSSAGAGAGAAAGGKDFPKAPTKNGVFGPRGRQKSGPIVPKNPTEGASNSPGTQSASPSVPLSAEAEQLKKVNGELKQRVLEQNRRIAQLEAAFQSQQQELEDARTHVEQMKIQNHNLYMHERDLRVQLQQAHYRVQLLVLEATVRGYIPTVMPKESSRVLLEDTEDVQYQSELLFESCEDKLMTADSPNLPLLASEVCGHPTYFAPVLFQRCLSDARARRTSDADDGVVEEIVGITLNDFLRYWQGLIDENHSDAVGKLWHLMKPPHQTHVTPNDLRPLIQALVDTHEDLAFLRENDEQREAYLETVLVSIFCSLHGQRACRISFQELKASNLSEAFDLVATQSVKHVLPFCTSYFNDVYSQFHRLDRKGKGYITMAEYRASGDSKLSDLMLERVFQACPRPFECPVAKAMNYRDFVWFWLADNDRMENTSLPYWFRCLDLDGDGVLTTSDLRHAYEMKVASLQRRTSAAVLDTTDALCSLVDVVNPRIPGQITCLDIKLAGAGTIVFDLLVSVVEGGSADLHFMV